MCIRDRNKGNEISAKKENELINIELTGETDPITGSIKGGQIDGYLKFLNGKGEFATAADTDKYENAGNVKGVLYYINMLDTLANKFATTMNYLNRVPNTYNADGTVAVSYTHLDVYKRQGLLFP